MTKILRMRALIASGALLASTGAALAYPATAVTNISVRSDPSSRSVLLDRLPAGETVNVIDCDEGWCEISMGRDGSGFVPEAYLDIRGRGAAIRSTVVIEDDEPEVITGLAIGGYWESRPYYIRDGYYYWGGRWYGARPGRPGWRNQSWRRWQDRREARIERRDDRRDDRRDRREDKRDDRRDARLDNQRDNQRERIRDNQRERRQETRQEDRGGGREQRIERREERAQQTRTQEPRAAPRDGGDRIGLDRAGGGRGDGGGRGGGGGGGDGRGGGGGDGRGGGGGGGGGRGDRN